MTRREFQEEIKSFVETQLAVWPEAKERYVGLGKVERKRFRSGRLHGAVQFNPGRSRSTTADISKSAIENRPCFLCRKNRPQEQIAIPIAEGWELLLNPYPIFPVHFTIASTTHKKQLPDLGSMIMLAEKMPGLVVFFNGAKAGASAPDHMHFQAVPVEELPLLREIEDAFPGSSDGYFDVKNKEDDTDSAWPFGFITAVVHVGNQGMEIIRRMMTPQDLQLVNLYVWIGNQGELRILEIPRKAHRPRCYTDLSDQLLISPGAIDMAGVIISVRPEDFERTPERVSEIYSDVAYDMGF